jgi:hypothetical protein
VDRDKSGKPYQARPKSLLELFGRRAANGYWSGLYGTTSTREGLSHLLQSANRPQAIFRVICQVSGAIVTSMGASDLARLGYLNLRYADAELSAQLEACWTRLAGIDNAHEAIHTRPDLAPRVVERIGAAGIALIVHPFCPPESGLTLNVATVLDTACIQAIRSRDRNLTVRLNTG